MSTATLSDRFERFQRRFDRASTLAFRVAFGDRIGLAVFLGCLCFAGLYWRVGFFINDNVTLANGLVALADGHLWVEEATFQTLGSPGMHEFEGRLYARNYGQLVLSLPALWLLQGLASVADFGLVFAALWSLCVLALFGQVGHLLDRHDALALGGAVLAGAFFVANLLFAKPLPVSQLPILALQLTALLATGLAAVFCYRLLARMHGRRLGLAAGAAMVAATPVGFWATIPKRHVFTVALVVGTAYALYRSRAGEDTTEGAPNPVWFRALAYVLVALLAWVHAAEGFILFIALVAVDVPTAPSNDRRTVAIVAGSFLVALLPVLVTNTLISGEPFRVPRMLPDFTMPEETGQSRGGLDLSGSSGSDSSSGGSSPLSGIVATFDEVTTVLITFGSLLSDGAAKVIRNTDVLDQIFVRSEYIASISRENNDQALYLTVFESAPLVAGAVAIAGSAAVVTLRERGAVVRSWATVIRHPRSLSPRRTVDAFVALAGLCFFLVYVTRLPAHAQVTVRYLLVLFPLGVYAMARLPSVRRVCHSHARTARWTWAIGVCIGIQVLFLAVVLLGFGRGEALQFHASINLLAGGAAAVLSVASVATDRFDRLVAIALGLAAALGTNFLLLSGLVYFQYGQYVLPAVDALAGLLSAV